MPPFAVVFRMCRVCDSHLLAQEGAVSEAVARDMALGALRHSKAQVSLAVTGVAGPSGGSRSKPVGTVCVALATAETTTVRTLQFRGVDRGRWKRMVALRDSPANCIIFDCGVTRELGENPVAVARYFGQRDRIGHVHYRNVRLRKPNAEYTEVYPDNGDNNMLAVMKELVAAKYKYMIFPEHARGLDVDAEFKTNNAAGWAYHVGYARAMLQTALAQR